MPNENKFAGLFPTEDDSKPQADTPKVHPKEAAKPEPVAPPEPQKKRGRPATGKRSDDAWISRAFYIQRNTDMDLEDEINKLRREGIKLDKSDLVDMCLTAWLKWRQGEKPAKCLGEISPRRNGE